MLFTLQQEVRRLYLFSVVSWPYLFLYQEWWLVWLGWGAEYYMPYMFLMVLDFIIILRVINFIIISNNKIISVRSVDNCRYSLWAFVSIYWIENSWYNSVFRSIAAPRIYSFLGGFLFFLSFFFSLQKIFSFCILKEGLSPSVTLKNWTHDSILLCIRKQSVGLVHY